MTDTPPALKPSRLKLIKAGLEIRTSPEPDGDDLACMAKELVQATLPHSDPGNVEAFTRRNGNRVLVIRPGWDVERGRPYGYPYGALPRLVLFWITAEAVRTKSPRLELGHSLHSFMRQLGLNPDNGSPGAKRSDAHRLRDQMQRLFRASISFEVIGRGREWRNMDVAPEGALWWDLREPDQPGLFRSWIELGPNFFRAITDAPVPAHMKALKALKRSPLALDLYAFVSYRAFVATQAGKAQFVTWKQLQGQLGTDYTHLQHFRAATKDALEKIIEVYPGMKLGGRLGGIEIVPGPSAVPPKPSRRKPRTPVDQ
jgi:hypothetical protein